MFRSVVYAVFTVATLLMPMAGASQGYSPGQTFPARQTPVPAQRVYQTPYPARQPVYRQPAPQQQLPVYRPATRTPVPRRTPVTRRPAGNMYNMTGRSGLTVKSDRNESRESDSSSKARDAENRTSSRERDKSDDGAARKTKSESSANDNDNDSDSKDDASEVKSKSDSDSKSADDKPFVPESTDKLTFFEHKTGNKWIALTYDDGPNPTLTPELIDYLVANHVPATFFMLGEMIKNHPEMVKRLADNGFELANHTYDHPNLNKKSSEEIRSQLQRTHDLIKEASGGVDVKLMRPPYGNHNSKVDAVCKDMGYKVIIWDVDTEDWRKHSVDQIMKTIKNETSDGSIILMHDRKHGGKKTSLEATKRTVDYYRARGYTFVTVGQMLGLDDQAPAAVAQPAPAVGATAATGQSTLTALAQSVATTATAPLSVNPLPAPSVTPAPILP